MLPLRSKKLDAIANERLKYLQSRVNKEKTFDKKVARAKSLWNEKKGSKIGKEAFENIEAVLHDLCIFEKTCNYCEHSEASDIEHIDPKSFYPERCFVWHNYLLACKSCNSEYKLDKCNTITKSGDLEFVSRGTKPKSKKTAFINPRKEDPAKYFILNLLTITFELNPDLTKVKKNKATSTLEILKLNERDLLIKARKSAAAHYFNKLDRISRILATTSKKELKNLLNPYDSRFDFTKSLTELKLEIKKSYKLYIKTYQHPSVWLSMKLHYQQIPKLKEIFSKLPEALKW